jgi:hypothetical protein
VASALAVSERLGQFCSARIVAELKEAVAQFGLVLAASRVSHYGAQTPDARPQLRGPGAAPVFQKSSADA